MRRLPRSILALGAAAVVLAGPAAAGDPEVTWYAIVTGEGVAVGHATVELRDTPTGHERIDYQETTLREGESRPMRVTERTVTRHDHAGRVVSISSESRVGQTRVAVEARVRPGAVDIRRTAAGERTAVSVPVGEHVRFDGGDGLIAAWDPARTPALEFEAFDLGARAVERVVLTPAPGARPDDQGRRAVLRARYDGDELRGVSRLTLDRDGQVASVVQPIFGTSLTVVPTDEATALKPRAPYRLVTHLMTKSPFRIPAAALDGHIRYRFGYRDGLAFPLPATGEQRVTVGADGTATVDICATCGPGLPADPAYLARARQSTAWLQSDDPRIRRVAAPVAALAVSDARKMEMLAKTARTYLGKIEFAGHFSASETLDRRRGDCTEAAVLLAAFGRAAGIPTKTASGYVYSRERYHGVSNVFMPHSWTLAYVDGRWRSFDAALANFDTSHIAVAIGDGDTRTISAAGQLAGLLTWDGITEVKARPVGASGR